MRSLTHELGTDSTSRSASAPASPSVSRAVVWANVDCHTASDTCSRNTPAHAVHRSCASPTSLNASPGRSESTSTSTHCGQHPAVAAEFHPLRPHCTTERGGTYDRQAVPPDGGAGPHLRPWP